MDIFQQQTAAFFTRKWIEYAMDRGDLDEVMAMSRRLDELTACCLREERRQLCGITATAGKA